MDGEQLSPILKARLVGLGNRATRVATEIGVTLMKAILLTLVLSMFILGASMAYVKASGGFTCSGAIQQDGGGGATSFYSHYILDITCG